MPVPPPQGLHGIFERFRGILHEGEIDKRVQYMIEGLFAVYKTKFAEHPAVHKDLDLVEPEDQFTHDIGLNDDLDKVRLVCVCLSAHMHCASACALLVCRELIILGVCLLVGVLLHALTCVYVCVCNAPHCCGAGGAVGHLPL